MQSSKSIFHTIFKLRMQSSRSTFSTIFKLRMQSSIFGPPGLYSARYSNSKYKALYSVLQVYIQQNIQHPNVELYIRSSSSIFNTIFKLRMYSSIFGSACLYLALYSTSECRTLYSVVQFLYSALHSTSQCRALYSVLLVCIQPYIQHTNVELYIRLSRSKLITIFNIQMQSSIFGPPCLYSALYSTSQYRALCSVLRVHIEHYIQRQYVMLYIRLYKSRCSTLYNTLMESSIFDSAGLYSALYSTSECRPLYSVLQVYIQHHIQTQTVELYIRLTGSIFSTIFKLRMQSSIFGSSGLYSVLYSNFESRALYSALYVNIQHYTVY